MIAFVTGTVVEIEDNKIVLELNGMGFQIFVPSTVVNRVTMGSQVKIYTHMSVKEDDISLFGFLTQDDLKMYRMLLNVNGVGPKAAIGVLSALSADELRFAVLADDAAAIAKAPGIGKKTAQKMILELKDKLSLEEAFEQKLQNAQMSGETGIGSPTAANLNQEAMNEAVQALAALGYSATDALRAVKQIDGVQNMTVEQILKHALKHL